MADGASLGGNSMAKSLIPAWGQQGAQNAGGAESPFKSNNNAGNSNPFFNAGKLQQNSGNGGQFTGSILGGGEKPQEEPSGAIGQYPSFGE